MAITPSKYLSGIIMFIAVISLGVSMIGIAYDYNPALMDSDKYSQFQSAFDKKNNVDSAMASLQQKLSQKGSPSLTDYLQLAYLMGTQMALSFFSSIGFSFSMFNAFETLFGIPGISVWMGVSLLTIGIIFAIAGAFLYKDL